MLTFVYYVTCKLMHCVIEKVPEYSRVCKYLGFSVITVLSRNQRISMRVLNLEQQRHKNFDDN